MLSFLFLHVQKLGRKIAKIYLHAMGFGEKLAQALFAFAQGFLRAFALANFDGQFPVHPAELKIAFFQGGNELLQPDIRLLKSAVVTSKGESDSRRKVSAAFSVRIRVPRSGAVRS
jgi:hypothetical protein